MDRTPHISDCQRGGFFFPFFFSLRPASSIKSVLQPNRKGSVWPVINQNGRMRTNHVMPDDCILPCLTLIIRQVAFLRPIRDMDMPWSIFLFLDCVLLGSSTAGFVGESSSFIILNVCIWWVLEWIIFLRLPELVFFANPPFLMLHTFSFFFNLSRITISFVGFHGRLCQFEMSAARCYY